MMWISLAIIVVFGGATLALHDETFIKWKPTVLYWLFAVSLAGSELLFRRNLIRAMLGEQVRMPDGVWVRLNWSWVAFFTLMGAANLLVAYNFPTDTWVNFKLFGGMGLMLAFVVLQALFLARYIEEKAPGRKPSGAPGPRSARAARTRADGSIRCDPRTPGRARAAIHRPSRRIREARRSCGRESGRAPFSPYHRLTTFLRQGPDHATPHGLRGARASDAARNPRARHPGLRPG